MGDGPPAVVLYTTPLCAPCEDLKAYLRSRDVPFTVKDLMMDSAAADLLESNDIWTAPALQVGEAFFTGADLERRRIDAVLGLSDAG